MEAVKNNLPGKPALKLNFGAKFYKPFWFKISFATKSPQSVFVVQGTTDF